MSMTFTKLFSSITESSIWSQPDTTRLVWITMLAMADRRGRVWASVPGLANRARVSIEDCKIALTCFLSQDEYSRTKDFAGVRIEAIDGGWRLLNHEKYRDIRDDETRREQNAIAQARFRGKQSKPQSAESKPTVSQSKPTRKPIADADADADADKNKEGEGPVASLPRAQKPTIEAIKLQAAKIGLSELEAEKFFDFYESNGWRVGKNPMKSWSAALSNWKRNASTFNQHSGGSSLAQAQPVQTVFGLTKIIEAKQAQADGLKSRWAVETGLETTWSSEKAREDFVALRVQIKKLNQQLAGMA